MADEPSNTELAWRQDRAEHKWDQEITRIRSEHQADVQRLEREHQVDIRRLEREHAEDLRALREDVIKPLQDRLRMTFGRWVGVLGVVAAFATLMVTAFATAKGVK